jgi:carbonic anhydrase
VDNDQDAFADVLAANRRYSEQFEDRGLAAVAAKGLAVVTCMDSRIDPLNMLGLKPGDAKILRNAGGRVTDDVLRTLVLGRYLLGVSRVMIMEHTGCKMASGTEEDVHAAIAAAEGPDSRSMTFMMTTDQEGSVRSDVQRVRSWPYLPDLTVNGFIYDLHTGLVNPVC